MVDPVAAHGAAHEAHAQRQQPHRERRRAARVGGGDERQRRPEHAYAVEQLPRLGQ